MDEVTKMKDSVHLEKYESVGDDTSRNLDTIEDTQPGPFVWMCAAATAIGGMLFGSTLR